MNTLQFHIRLLSFCHLTKFQRKPRNITFPPCTSLSGICKMEKDKDSITLSISDETSDSVGHIIIHENPESPDATPSDSTDHISDNESVTSADSSAYNADTLVDSPTSNSSTLYLNTSQDSTDESEVGDASSECNESHGFIRNFDETGLLFLPSLPIYNPSRSIHSILMGAAMKGQNSNSLIIPGKDDLPRGKK